MSSDCGLSCVRTSVFEAPVKGAEGGGIVARGVVEIFNASFAGGWAIFRVRERATDLSFRFCMRSTMVAGSKCARKWEPSSQ